VLTQNKNTSFRFRRCIVQSTLGMAPLNLCFYILFYVFLLSLFTRITSALFIYDKRTLLDIGHHSTNLLQDTLSTDLAWPLEILRNTEVNKGRLDNPRRRKTHRGRRAVLCQFAIACILSCPVLSALSCRAKAASCLVFPYGVVLVCCCFFVVVLNKSPSLCTIESSPHPFIPSSLTLTSPFFYIGWL